MFGANQYVWVYYKGSVWGGKEFDAKKLPASKSYLDVNGRLAAAAHPTEGTFPLHRRWLWCFCPGCRAVDAADAAAVQARGAGGGAVGAGAHRCQFEKWVGKYGVVNTCAASDAGIRAAKAAGVTKFMTGIEPGGLLVVIGESGTRVVLFFCIASDLICVHVCAFVERYWLCALQGDKGCRTGIDCIHIEVQQHQSAPVVR